MGPCHVFANVVEEAVEEALAVEGVEEEEDGAVVEVVDRAGLREKPNPQGATLVVSLELT